MIKIRKKAVRTELIKHTQTLVSAGNFPWNLNEEGYEVNKDIYKGIESKLNKKYKAKDTYQLVHPIYKENIVKPSLYYDYFIDLYKDIVKTVIKKDTRLLRMKVNLLFNTKKPTVNNFHLDSADDNNYMSLIYYINDSDGDTLLYKNGKLIRVTPEAGKVLLFDGNIYHASSNPVKTKLRKVVNINFKYV
tara:strand:+ start:42 stop:611 length:570 start_codon:yes stop_codon:yes gene_type:complete